MLLVVTLLAAAEALAADFKPAKLHTATVALVPPEAMWPPIQQQREALRDRGLYRWPPHINLLYPFLAREEFPPAAELLTRALRDCRPPVITLDALSCFGGRGRGVLYAHPSSEEEMQALCELQATLQEAMPFCDEQQKHGRFTPHMTISHFASRDEAEAAKARIEWSPLTFGCEDAVHILCREGSAGQFMRACTLSFGSAALPTLFDPPRRWQSMPMEEDEWMRDARRDAYRRGAQGRRGGRRRRPRRSPEERARVLARTPEDIAMIRAERAAKREKLSYEAEADA
jgi:2'-5' RNA ligase